MAENYFTPGKDHETRFRAGLVRFGDDGLTGQALCKLLANEDANAIHAIFEGFKEHFSALGTARRWPIIVEFIVPALRSLASQALVEGELLEPLDTIREPRLRITLVESLNGGRLKRGDYCISAVHSGLADPALTSKKNAPWLHWASRHMVSAQLERKEADFIAELKAEAAREKRWKVDDVCVEFTLVSPLVSIEPVGVANGPIVIELELAVTPSDAKHCKVIFYDATEGRWRLARHARLDDALSSRLALGQSLDGNVECVGDTQTAVARVEVAHTSIWAAVSSTVFNATLPLRTAWRRPTMQIAVHAFAFAGSDSQQQVLHFLFGVRGDGELEMRCADLRSNGCVQMTMNERSWWDLRVYCDMSRIDVKLRGGGDVSEQLGWCIWQNTVVPQVTLHSQHAGDMEIEFEPTSDREEPTGRLRLRRRAGALPSAQPAQVADAARFAGDDGGGNAHATQQLIVPCSPTVAPLHNAVFEANSLHALMPNARILDQTNGETGAETIWSSLTDAGIQVNVFVLLAHCDARHLDTTTIAFVNRSGDLQTLSPAVIARNFKHSGRDLRLIFLNGCCSSKLAECVMEARNRELRCVIGWSTVVETNAARAFSYLFFEELTRDGRFQRLGEVDTFHDAFVNAVTRLQEDGLQLEAHWPYNGHRWIVGDPKDDAARAQASQNGLQLAGIPVCLCAEGPNAKFITISGDSV